MKYVKNFSTFVNESADADVNEGKMKDIFAIAKDSSSKADFITRLKAHLIADNKADLAKDENFLDGMADMYMNAEKEEAFKEETEA